MLHGVSKYFTRVRTTFFFKAGFFILNFRNSHPSSKQPLTKFLGLFQPCHCFLIADMQCFTSGGNGLVSFGHTGRTVIPKATEVLKDFYSFGSTHKRSH